MKVKDLFIPLLLGAAALFAYDRFNEAGISPSGGPTTSADFSNQGNATHNMSPPSVGSAAPVRSATAEGFKCDGRTHCSQMRSCSEAMYFLQHCPGTKMDGNGDGEPCEEQWCN